MLLLAEGAVRSGHVVVDGLHLERADVRGRRVRPHGFGVEAPQGGFTLWNRQADAEVVITADLRGLSAGSEQSPVRGCGVFVGGHGDWEGRGDGGVLNVSTLRTGEIHTDGGTPPGTPDLISGGVFVISGAVVEEASFESIATHGDGSTGVQVSKPLPRLEIERDLTTVDGEGMSLVKGGQMTLRAVAPSVKAGGSVGKVVIGGEMRTAGDDVVTLEVEGAIEQIDVAGSVKATALRVGCSIRVRP